MISVVIPTFNRKWQVLRALKAIPSDVQVIVVDDGCTDGTEDVVRGMNRSHLLYIKRQNGGPAAARNAGILAASGDHIAFTDDDCVPVFPWPWPLVSRLEREGRGVAGVGGRVGPLHCGVFSRYYTFHRVLEPPESCPYLVTANCAYRRDVLLQVGGFDARIRHPGGEDPGLSMKVRAKGYRLAFEPQALVLHAYRESLRDFVRTFMRYGKGCAYVMGA